jgi:hypothetical protein
MAEKVVPVKATLLVITHQWWEILRCAQNDNRAECHSERVSL